MVTGDSVMIGYESDFLERLSCQKLTCTEGQMMRETDPHTKTTE